MSREMKESGVEWIGKIPEDWEIIPNKHLMKKVKNLCPVYNGEDILSLSMKGVYVRDPNDESGKRPTTYNGYQHVQEGDLLMCLFDIDVTPRCVGRVYNDGLTSPAYSRFVMNKTRAIVDYYYYYYLALDFDKTLLHLSKNMRSSLTESDFGSINAPVPSHIEQQQIVKFLDFKCTAIDTAIEKTKKSIEKLEEYKKAVITKAVTKGIDPNVRMKDAHFLWLTAIPEKWGIYKLNHILDYNHPYPLGDGDHGSIKADSYVSSGIPFIRVQNLGYAEPINIENVVYITEVQNQKIQNSTLAPNDILFAKTGATIGKTAIMPQTISRANTTSHIGKITVDTRYYVPKYIFYALSSEIGNHQLWSIANKKATRPEVGLDEVKYIKLCIPLSVTEQKQIADFLDEKLNQINNAISNHANLIRKLEEYKKSLIYYAVTGKIDCRGEKL